MKGRRRGHSLVELIVAAALTGVVLVAVTSSLPLAFGTLRKSDDTIVSAGLARQYLEWWSSRPFAQLQSRIGHSETYVDPLPASLPPEPNPQHQGTLLPADCPGSYRTTVTFTATSDPNLIQVDAAVQGENAHVDVHTEVFNVTNPW